MFIVFGKGQGLISKAIRFFTRYTYTHAALRYSGAESEWVVHSTFGGVQPAWWSDLTHTYPELKAYRCTFEVADKAIDVMVERFARKGYGYTELLGAGIAIALNNLFKIKLKKNPFGSSDTYMCTELIAEFLKVCNELDPNLKIEMPYTEFLQPKHLEEYFKTRPDLFHNLGIIN